MSQGRPLRVGLVCPYSFDRPGGVQNHVLGLAAYLRDAGHEPYVLGPGRPDALAGPDHAGLDLSRRFTSAGTAVPVPYNGSVARVNFGPFSAARVRHWVRRSGFDLLHLHEPITPSVSVLALWAADLPVAGTFHTATPRSRTMQLAGGVLHRSVAKIGARIAVSEPARQVVQRYLNRDAQVVPNGFRFADFPPRPARVTDRTHPRTRRLVFLGRVEEPRKGLGVLLAALPAIQAAVPDLEVVVAGHGYRDLPPSARRTPTPTDAGKAALLAGADVFVAPHTARESFGIVLLEAMAAGAPVVASDLPAFTQLLRHDPRRPEQALGRVFATGDPRALAAAVVDALHRPDFDQQARARAHARRFDWSVVGPEVLQVYRELLATSQDPPVPSTRAVSHVTTNLAG